MVKFVQKNLLAVVILLIIVVVGAFSLISNESEKAQKPVSTTEKKEVVATVVIKADSAEKRYELTSGVGKTALEVSNQATGNKVVTKGEGVNAFVTTINGREASDAKHEFWKLIVNGKDSEVGAGSYTVGQGDNITWVIDTY